MATTFSEETEQKRKELERAWKRIEEDEMMSEDVLWLFLQLGDAWEEIDALKAAQGNAEPEAAEE